MQFFPKPKSCRLSKFHSITGDIFINSGNIAGIYVDFFMKNTAELNLRTYGRRFSQLLAPIGDDNIISHVATDGFQVSRVSVMIILTIILRTLSFKWSTTRL